MPVFQPDTVSWTGQIAFGDANGLNPSSNTSYYFGTLFGVDPGTADNPPGYFVPRDGRLRAVFGRIAVVGTQASTHNCTVVIRKNATTDILTVVSTLQLNAAICDFKSTGNSVSVSKGDSVYAKLTTGAFTTNPTVVFGNAVLSFEAP